MDEKAFLELSSREQDIFIAMNVFGFQWVAWKEEKHKEYHGDNAEEFPNTKWLQYLDPKHEWHIEPTEADLPLNEKPYRCIPEYQSWQGMGKGIEHANENGYYPELYYSEKPAVFFPCLNRELVEAENIFLAFWIAYMKALGVLE